jgi:polysaccharide deacetylase 2 family uncharacterized protein YibQ
VDKHLVIIIDDMGYQYSGGRSVLELPGKLTVAVLPHTPFGRKLAEEAPAAGKEVMLHAPMSNLLDKPLGPGGLTAEQSEQEFHATLDRALHELPQVRGVNNHMGSDLTQRREQMAWLMDGLLRHGLYFVDSRTSADSVAAQTAIEHGVPNLSRQVFLDNERNQRSIAERFRRLLGLVEKSGMAVGIGHPYPETVEFLADALPRLKCRGIELAHVSEVLAERTGYRQLARAQVSDSEPDLDPLLSHVGLGLGYGVLAEVENAGGEYGVGTAYLDAVNQMVEIANTP